MFVLPSIKDGENRRKKEIGQHVNSFDIPVCSARNEI